MASKDNIRSPWPLDDFYRVNNEQRPTKAMLELAVWFGMAPPAALPDREFRIVNTTGQTATYRVYALPARPGRQPDNAFTAIEVLIVITIIAIVASLVVPMVSHTNVSQLRAAVQMLVADLEFAQMASVAHGEDARVVVFDSINDVYHIGTQSDPTTPITNPTDGKPYSVPFGADRAFQLPDVTISGYALGGDNQLGFGIYGQLDQSTAATITLAVTGHTVTITLDPVTGEASVGTIDIVAGP